MNEDSLAAAEVSPQDFESIGGAIDAAMRALAKDVLLHPDTATLAALLAVENGYLFAPQQLDYDELLAAILDHTVPALPRSELQRPPLAQDVLLVSNWIPHAECHQKLSGALINAVNKRMTAVRTLTGRIAIFPSQDANLELRNRWFILRWRARYRGHGDAVLMPNMESALPRLDAHIFEHWQDLLSGHYAPPVEPWFDAYCASFVDQALAAQFRLVADDELWGAITVAVLKRALRPLWLRAARRLLGHTRAVTLLKQAGCATPLLSSIEQIPRQDLEADLAGTGLDSNNIKSLLDSMTRLRGEEKNPIPAYPLIPLTDGTVAFMPSCILHATWPAAREMAVGRGTVNPSAIGTVRAARQVPILAEALASGAIQPELEVVVKAPDGRTLTDLDLVHVSDDLKEVLVVQLKSFVTPTNLIDLRTAEREVSSAATQCAKARDNRSQTRCAIEKRFRRQLPDDWKLFQIIAVEARIGAFPTPPEFPFVSLEWVESEGATYLRNGGPAALHDAACNLPDARQFFDSYRGFFFLFDDESCALKLILDSHFGEHVLIQ